MGETLSSFSSLPLHPLLHKVASQHDICPEGANMVETGVEMFQDTDVITGGSRMSVRRGRQMKNMNMKGLAKGDSRA